MSTFDNISIIAEAQARARNFRPLTEPICAVHEGWILRNIIADMQRGRIAFALVAVTSAGGTGVEVWRAAPGRRAI